MSTAVQTPFTESSHPYWARRDSNAELILPASALGVAPTAGLSYAWGAYPATPFTTGYATPLVVVGLAIQITSAVVAGTATSIWDLQWQIRAGAVGAETTLAHGQEVRSIANPSPNTINVVVAISQFWRCDPILVAESTRLTMRATQSSASNQVILSAYLVAYDASKFSFPVGGIDLRRFLQGTRLMTTTVTPSAAAGTAVISGGSAWGFGSWTNIIASASRDMLITSIGCDPASVSGSMQGEIGVGTDTVAAFGFPRRTASGNCVGMMDLYRPVFVKAGEAVAIRIKSSSATQTFNFWLQDGDLL